MKTADSTAKTRGRGLPPESDSSAPHVVLLGLATPQPGDELAYARRLFELAEGLRGFFFVKNNSLFMGDLVSEAEPVDAEQRPASGGGA